jgi:cell division protein FtsL
MTIHKIGEDAFSYWVWLGQERTYAQVAERYKCTKRAVQKVADKERWVERLAEIEKDAAEKLDKKLGDDLVEMRSQQLKVLQAVLSCGVKALAAHSLDTGYQGVCAIEKAIKLQRLILGETTENTAHTVEQVTRQEIERLIVMPDEPGSVPDADDGDEDW